MNDLNHRPYKGQCLCGQIQYEVDEIGPKLGHCHCSMCRKFHGAAFATLAEAKIEDFRWVMGEEHLSTFLATNGTQRKFCKHCGSSLIFVPSNDSGQLVEFSLGTLDTNISNRPDAHIFTDSKACWFEISDALPQFTQGRDSKQNP